MSVSMTWAVLNMPLPDDPSELDAITWVQFRSRAREAAADAERWRARAEAAEAELERLRRAARLTYRTLSLPDRSHHNLPEGGEYSYDWDRIDCAIAGLSKALKKGD